MLGLARVGFLGVGFLKSVGLREVVGLGVGFLGVGFLKSVGLEVGVLKMVGLRFGTW